MFYDHLLAKNWTKYSEISLNQFSEEFYRKLVLNKNDLPINVRSSLQYLITGNWFKSYSTIEGLKKILLQMETRTNYPSELSSSVEKFVSLLPIIEPQFFLFFEDIQNAVKQNLIKN
jgi:acyl carrier protein phosphodiesterase